jgi:hypothetical protein
VNLGERRWLTFFRKFSGETRTSLRLASTFRANFERRHFTRNRKAIGRNQGLSSDQKNSLYKGLRLSIRPASFSAMRVLSLAGVWRRLIDTLLPVGERRDADTELTTELVDAQVRLRLPWELCWPSIDP